MPRVDPVNAASAERNPGVQRPDSPGRRALAIARASERERQEGVRRAAEVVRQTQTEGRVDPREDRGANLDVLA